MVDLEELTLMSCNPPRRITEGFEKGHMVSIFLHNLFYHIWQIKNENFFESKKTLKQLLYQFNLVVVDFLNAFTQETMEIAKCSVNVR